MARLVDGKEKRLAELKKEVTKRGFDRHAAVLNHISELSAELQSPAVTALAGHENIEHIIAFPPQIQRGWHYVPKQALLFTATGVTHLLASIWPGEEPQITCLKGCGLMYMKVTLLLLYGFLEIVAQGQDVPAQLSLEFHTVAWHYLSPPLRQFLRGTKAAPGSSTDQTSYSAAAQTGMKNLPIKFSNGVKIYGLLPGEELEELVFQAGTWKRWLYFFRRPISADTLLLLTTNFVVVIREELDVRQGWVLSYIPRNGISEMQNQPRGLGNELSVQLKREDQSAEYKLTLESEAVEAWRMRWIQHGGQWQNLPGEPI